MISGDVHWADRLKELLAEFPDIPIEDMGFPPGWEKLAFWRTSPRTPPA